MAPDTNGLQIVERWTDRTCGTGEEKLRTADGRTWRTVYSTPTITGANYHVVRGDRLEPKP